MVFFASEKQGRFEGPIWQLGGKTWMLAAARQLCAMAPAYPRVWLARRIGDGIGSADLARSVVEGLAVLGFPDVPGRDRVAACRELGSWLAGLDPALAEAVGRTKSASIGRNAKHFQKSVQHNRCCVSVHQ